MKGKDFEKQSDYLWQAILILSGIALIVVSFIDPDEGKRFATENGLGCSLLLSGILGAFMRLLSDRSDR